MTNLVPNGGVAQVPEIEVSTPLLGGPGGPLNQQSQGILNAMLMAWALTQSVQLVSASRDSNEAIVTANIVWYLPLILRALNFSAQLTLGMRLTSTLRR
jgi:hypothetical protein